MLGLLDTATTGIKVGAGMLLGALIAFPIGHLTGGAAERGRNELELATSALAAEKERVADDAVLSNLADYDLCVRGLRSRGMPIEACDELRRIPAE